MSWDEDEGYIPVAKRREFALAKMDELREDGIEVHPVEAFKTRGIAKSFWGKAWCRHIEQWCDYEDRLPRGRSGVRNGSVCHLELEAGQASAWVAGAQLAQLTIQFEPLDPGRWEEIQRRCRGKIGSLVELLQGKISDEVLEIVTDPETGILPSPNELCFSCNCEDWAEMCDHVAAVMYGIGVRLDEEPEWLFTLRGVNQEDLIVVETAVDELTDGSSSSRRRRRMDSGAMEQMFGIELADE